MSIESPSHTSQLPSYLSHHFNLGFDTDDVTALLNSIDSSQKPKSASVPHLPAELLLHILEYVPVDYVLDWRLVCRGFRDAIDGRILFYHLHRTKLIGYMGSQHSRLMEDLGELEYNRIYLLYANFHHIESVNGAGTRAQPPEPVWNATHAIFRIEDEWFQSFRQIGGAAERGGDTIEDADPRWLIPFSKLELRRPEEGFGTLRWCIKLDHAVLDADFPIETGRTTFGIEVNLRQGIVKVAWRQMLIHFLKTETALRRLTQEVSIYTSSSKQQLTCITEKRVYLYVQSRRRLPSRCSPSATTSGAKSR